MARNMLDLIRPLVAEIDGTGMIARTEGAHAGFLGRDPATLEGTSVFDHVSPEEGTRLANYFIENSTGGMETVHLPVPFRIEMLDINGVAQPVDIIPTAYEEDGLRTGWVVVALPVALTTAICAPLEAEMAGAPRSEVRRLLAKELEGYRSRWMFVDLAPAGAADCVEITVAESTDDRFARAAEAEIANGWKPWASVGGRRATLLLPEQMPDAVRDELMALDLDVVVAAPVTVQGRVVAAYLNVSCRGAGVERRKITANVMNRITSLVKVTSLVLERWQDRDDLNQLARTDALTGLANRQAFGEALDQPRLSAALLYVDVDGFKQINDAFGHEAGDRVLREVAQRIAASCRPTDVVARVGGDEFAVLLDDIDIDTAIKIGHRIVQNVRVPMPIPGCGQVTVSAGLARSNDRNRCIDAADQAMLTAKRSGRDRLVVA